MHHLKIRNSLRAARRLAARRQIQLAAVASLALAGYALTTGLSGNAPARKSTVHAQAKARDDAIDPALAPAKVPQLVGDPSPLLRTALDAVRNAVQRIDTAAVASPSIQPASESVSSASEQAGAPAAAPIGCTMGSTGANAAASWQTCLSPTPGRISVTLPRATTGPLPSVDGPSVSLGQLPSVSSTERTVTVVIGLDPRVTGPSVNPGNPVVVAPAGIEAR